MPIRPSLVSLAKVPKQKEPSRFASAIRKEKMCLLNLHPPAVIARVARVRIVTSQFFQGNK